MQRNHEIKVRITVEVNVPVKTTHDSKEAAVDHAVKVAPGQAKSMLGSFITNGHYREQVDALSYEIVEHSIIALVPTPERVS